MYQKMTHEITPDPHATDYVEVWFSVPLTLARGRIARVDLRPSRLEPEILPFFEKLYATGEVDSIAVAEQGRLWRVRVRRAARRGRVLNQLKTILKDLPDQVAVVSDKQLYDVLTGSSLRRALEKIFEANHEGKRLDEAIEAYHTARQARVQKIVPPEFLSQEGTPWPHSMNLQTAVVQEYGIAPTLQTIARDRGGVALSCLVAVRNPASGGPYELAVRHLGEPTSTSPAK